MFGIGPAELLLVAGVALVVVGPRKLPGFMKEAAQVVGQVKKAGRRIKQAVDPQDELGAVGREVQSAVHAAQGEFVNRPAGLDDGQMVCTPEEEWAAAIAAADAPAPPPAGEPAEAGAPAPPLADAQMVCTPEEEWAAAIAAIEAQEQTAESAEAAKPAAG